MRIFLPQPSEVSWLILQKSYHAFLPPQLAATFPAWLPSDGFYDPIRWGQPSAGSGKNNLAWRRNCVISFLRPYRSQTSRCSALISREPWHASSPTGLLTA